MHRLLWIPAVTLYALAIGSLIKGFHGNWISFVIAFTLAGWGHGCQMLASRKD